MIKQLHSIFCILFLVGCTTNAQLSAGPDWYKNRTLLKNSDEYIGYGQGIQHKDAVLQAKSELALSIKSNINYILNSRVETTNDQVVKSTQSATSIQSNLTLSDIKSVKQEKVGNMFFVAYKYSNLPVIDKISNKNIALKCTLKQHSYLSQTPLIKSIANRLFSKDQHEKGCQPDFEVIYKQGNWHLMLMQKNEKRAMFALSENDFKLLFTSVADNAIGLDLSKSNLRAGELYHINLNVKKAGYLSLFYLSGDGQIQALTENKPMLSSSEFSYPDLTKYDGLAAETNQNNNFSQDLILAVLCKNKQDFSLLPSMTNDIVDTSTQYLFKATMKQINECRVSSKILKITGK